MGIPLALIHATGHLDHIEADYRRLARLGIATVRESVGWRLAARGPGFCFSVLDRIAQAALRHGVQVIWTLMHYGFPADADPFSDGFVEKFARFAEAVAKRVRRHAPAEAPFYAPINEISFLSWALTETGLIHPYDGSLRHLGYAVKRRLVAAAMAAMDAIRGVEPRARFIHVDPVIHVIAPPGAPHLEEEARRYRDAQFQAWDMLAGKLEPQLGGSASYLDIVGLNYYHSNQWEFGTGERLHWHARDPRRLPFRALIEEVRDRYRLPLCITETSHVGEGRAAWLEEIGCEVLAAARNGVHTEGVCLYPIIDRPDWQDAAHWHHSGLWDVGNEPARRVERVLHRPYARALRRWQRKLGHPVAPSLSP